MASATRLFDELALLHHLRSDRSLIGGNCRRISSQMTATEPVPPSVTRPLRHVTSNQ
jgi:hypothetical protein